MHRLVDCVGRNKGRHGDAFAGDGDDLAACDSFQKGMQVGGCFMGGHGFHGNLQGCGMKTVYPQPVACGKGGFLTLAWTEFRPEALPLAEEAMVGHDLVLLEEPPTPGFAEMLAGQMELGAYLELTDFEFPAYQEAQCRMLRRLHGRGVRILQVHPWLEQLLAVQEFFLAGGTPKDLRSGTPAGQVYAVERAWTEKLLAFYLAAGGPDFAAMVEALIAFAAADAAKFAAQDAWRARAIAELVAPGQRVYVEAGAMHWGLWRELFRLGLRPRPWHVLGAVARARVGRRPLAPGDVLTLRFLAGVPRDEERERLLAARTLVYNRLIRKDEMLPSATEPFPHLVHEAAVLERLAQLDFPACRTLFFRLRRLAPEAAWEVLQREAQ